MLREIALDVVGSDSYNDAIEVAVLDASQIEIERDAFLTEMAEFLDNVDSFDSFVAAYEAEYARGQNDYYYWRPAMFDQSNAYYEGYDSETNDRKRFD